MELTEREKEITMLLIKRMNNRLIAEKLGIGEGTVQNAISMIYKKLGIEDREQAIQFLLTQKL